MVRHGFQGVFVLSMVLRMTSSFRMQAVITTLKGLPAASRRAAKRVITGLKVRAVSAAMYKVQRTEARPPRIERLPRLLPLSRLKGASPTRALIC